MQEKRKYWASKRYLLCLARRAEILTGPYIGADMKSLFLKAVFLSLMLITAQALAQEYGSFTDSRDGRTYKTVQIGGETWLAENMKYIARDIDYKESKRPDEYGYLYNWADARKVCPAGWHLPSRVDFDRLISTLGKGFKASDSVRHKKWDGARNSTGFGALPVGYCDKDGCAPFASAAYFWANSERNASQAYGLYVDSSKVTVSSGKKVSYLSVRCVRSEASAAEEKAIIASYEKQKKNYLASSLTLGITGGAGIITGLVFLGAAAGRQESRDFYVRRQQNNHELWGEERKAFFDYSEEINAEESYAHRDRIAGLIILSAGCVAVAGSVVLGILRQRTSREMKKLKEPQVAILPAFSKDAGSLTLALSF